MSREKWKLIRQRKGFYIGTFRRIGSILVISMSLNLILGLSVIYVYMHKPENKFYATNGATPPNEVVPMDQPNLTSSPLLANDPVNDEPIKVIPQ